MPASPEIRKVQTFDSPPYHFFPSKTGKRQNAYILVLKLATFVFDEMTVIGYNERAQP